MAMGGGFHTSNPQAATFWNPRTWPPATTRSRRRLRRTSGAAIRITWACCSAARISTGRTRATPTSLLRPQNGTWILKQRREQTKDMTFPGANAAVVQLDASGKATNTLEVRVGADKIDYVVNGMVVGSTPKTAVATDGIYGFRVNHALPEDVITALPSSGFRDR